MLLGEILRYDKKSGDAHCSGFSLLTPVLAYSSVMEKRSYF